MTGFFKHFGLCAILSSVQVTGIDFTISRDKVVIGSTGTLTMRCDVTENDVDTIYLIEIRRETESGSNNFETLVQMGKGDATTETPTLKVKNNNKDFVAGGTFDKTTPSNTYLSVSMNISKLVCDDAKAYRCELTYRSTAGASDSVEKNGTFSAYVYPKVKKLEGKKNDFIVKGPSSTDQAAFDVGDELELSCTANIGSLSATTIRWRKTYEMGTTGEFLGYQPQTGSFDEGTAISDNQCGYTRIATITYNTTVADANRNNNLAFECFVSVSGNPYGTTYTTQNNPTFYADVSGGDEANEVTGIDFTFSRDKVVIGSTGTLTLRCDVTENDVDIIYAIQIRRESQPGTASFESLAEMDIANIEPTLTVTNNKGFVAGGTFNVTTPGNTYLSVSMNISKLQCDDARAYKCVLSYKATGTGTTKSVEKNGFFSAYVYPQMTQLEGKRNGIIVQGSSSTDQAAFNVGDILELSCTANIGSLPATAIRWRKTSEIGETDEFIGYQPQAGFDDGSAISDNQCGYTRIATITYNTTVADANRDNNLAFECYISVSGNPYGTAYTTQNNPRFYADVSGGDQAKGGDRGISDDKGIADNKVTKLDLTAGAIGGVIVAVIILGVCIIVFIVRRKLTTNEAPRTGLQTENSSIGNNQIQSTQPEIGQIDQSSIPGMYEHLQHTVEMENENVYYSLKADSEGTSDSKAHEKLQQAVCTPPTYTSLKSATLNKDGERAYENL